MHDRPGLQLRPGRRIGSADPQRHGRRRPEHERPEGPGLQVRRDGRPRDMLRRGP